MLTDLWNDKQAGWQLGEIQPNHKLSLGLATAFLKCLTTRHHKSSLEY